jgi:hypothetical protein
LKIVVDSDFLGVGLISLASQKMVILVVEHNAGETT